MYCPEAVEKRSVERPKVAALRGRAVFLLKIPEMPIESLDQS